MNTEDIGRTPAYYQVRYEKLKIENTERKEETEKLYKKLNELEEENRELKNSIVSVFKKIGR